MSLAVLAIGATLAPTLAAEAQVAPGDYRMHAGDKISVAVWKEEEMQRDITVRPDGKISFPLSGEVQAAGRTADEVRGDIEGRLRKFIPEPVVTVSVLEVNGNRVFVIGQVKQAGMYVMNPQLNVLQALSMAGGATPFAKLDDIIIVRGSGGRQTSLPFRYSDVATGKSLAQNIILESGDVIVVP